MKLSHLNKCWLVANIERVIVPPFGIISVFILVGVFQPKKGLQPFSFSEIGTLGIIGLIITGLIGLFYAYKIANFAQANFEEVVSRRTKWGTSNVDLHEMKYRFVLRTFGWAFFSIYAPMFSIICLISYF